MSGGGSSRSGRDAAPAAEAVLAAARRRSAALVARDAQALRALHHPDFRFTTPRGDVRDRDQYIAGNTAGELVWRDQHLVAHEVVIHGDTAVLVAVVHDAFDRGGIPGGHDMRLTLVWVKAGEDWIVLAAHAGPAVEPHV
jgi:ketosteroid isomerase-like protein